MRVLVVACSNGHQCVIVGRIEPGTIPMCEECHRLLSVVEMRDLRRTDRAYGQLDCIPGGGYVDGEVDD